MAAIRAIFNLHEARRFSLVSRAQLHACALNKIRPSEACAEKKLANIFRNTSQQHLAKNFPSENFPLYGKVVHLQYCYLCFLLQVDCWAYCLEHQLLFQQESICIQTDEKTVMTISLINVPTLIPGIQIFCSWSLPPTFLILFGPCVAPQACQILSGGFLRVRPQTEFDCQDVIAAGAFFGEDGHYTSNTRGAFDVEHV